MPSERAERFRAGSGGGRWCREGRKGKERTEKEEESGLVFLLARVSRLGARVFS